jgi:hypothetical protein
MNYVIAFAVVVLALLAAMPPYGWHTALWVGLGLVGLAVIL